MMLTKADCRRSLAFTTTLTPSAVREGSQRRKACRQEDTPTVTQLFSGCSFTPPPEEVSTREFVRCGTVTPPLIDIYVRLFLFL